MNVFALLALALIAEPIYGYDSKGASEALDTILKDYDKRIRPDNDVEVEVSAHLIKAGDYRVETNDFEIDFYFRHTWKDNRLTGSSGDEVIRAGADVANLIWRPDTFFTDDNKAHMGRATADNVFVRIHSNGTVFTSGRYSARVKCDGDLGSFPRDQHTCSLRFESYGFDMSAIDYKWKEPKPITTTASLIGFNILKTETRSETEQLSSGKYKSMIIDIEIVRLSKEYIIRYFLPMMITTLLSFAPLFMSKQSAYRPLLSAIIFPGFLLSMVSIFLVVSPKTGTATLMDCYLFTSLLFVSASFLLTMFVSIRSNCNEEQDGNGKKNDDSEQVERVNRLGCYAILGLYLIFNGIFWLSFAMN
ncbi:Gamma-aminobutyric acid receptor subunit beta [Halotydeus destructor]|nr:Gamma-aminobutyric acid receptor subunit beta [Halotydeus destructor]